MNKLVTRLTSAAAACLVVVAGVAVAQSNDTSGKGTTGPDTGASPTLPDPNNTMPAAPSSTTTPSSTSSPSTVTTPSTGSTGTSSYNSGSTTSTPSTTDSSTAPADSTLPARSDRN